MRRSGNIAPPTGYAHILDNFGLGAHVKATDSHDQRNTVAGSVRLQSCADPSLNGVHSIADVNRNIETAREMQGRWGRADLYERTWEPVADVVRVGEDVPKPAEHGCRRSNRLAVAQFNCLAEGLSSGPFDIKTPFTMREGRVSNDYGGFTSIRNPEIVLDFSLRRWRLCEELLRHYDGIVGGSGGGENVVTGNGFCRNFGAGVAMFDLIGMEEVDRYEGFFRPVLAKFGYSGLFVPKPSSPCTQLGWYSDGCALFWKDDSFEILSEKRGTYQVGSQVFIIATLLHRPTDRVVVAAVSHLKAKEGEANDWLRSRQAQELVQEVNAAVVSAAAMRSRGARNNSDVSILIMGDLNSAPSVEGKACVQIVTAQSETEPCLRSAYPLDQASVSRTGFYTTWKIRGTKTVKRIIDYIFYGTTTTNDRMGGLRCTHTLGVPREDEVEAGALPGLRYPSDHIMIGAMFELDG